MDVVQLPHTGSSHLRVPPKIACEELIKLFCWLLGKVKKSDPCKENAYVLENG